MKYNTLLKTMISYFNIYLFVLLCLPCNLWAQHNARLDQEESRLLKEFSQPVPGNIYKYGSDYHNNLKSFKALTEVPDSIHGYILIAENDIYRDDYIKTLPFKNTRWYYKYDHNNMLISSNCLTYENNDFDNLRSEESWEYDTNGNLLLYKIVEPKNIYFNSSGFIESNIENLFNSDNKIIKKEINEVREVRYNYFSNSVNDYYYNEGRLDSIVKKELYPVLPPKSCETYLNNMQYLHFFEKYKYSNTNYINYILEKKSGIKQNSYNCQDQYKFIYSLEKRETQTSDMNKKTVIKYFDTETVIDFNDLENMTDEYIDNLFDWYKIYELDEKFNENGSRDSVSMIFRKKQIPTKLQEEYFTVSQYRAGYTYNDQGLVSEIKYEKPVDSTDNKWMTFLKMNYYYTNKGSLLLYEKKFFDYKTYAWVLQESEHYYYPGLPTIIKKNEMFQEPAALKIFPNPVKDIIQISNTGNGMFNYEITNLQGVMVLNDCSENRKIDVSKLKEGIYILRLFYNHNTYLGKFIKVK